MSRKKRWNKPNPPQEEQPIPEEQAQPIEPPPAQPLEDEPESTPPPSTEPQDADIPQDDPAACFVLEPEPAQEPPTAQEDAPPNAFQKLKDLVLVEEDDDAEFVELPSDSARRKALLKKVSRDAIFIGAVVLSAVSIVAFFHQWEEVQYAKQRGYYDTLPSNSVNTQFRDHGEWVAREIVDLQRSKDSAALNDWEFSMMDSNVALLEYYEDGDAVYTLETSEPYTVGWEYKYVNNAYYTYNDGNFSATASTQEALESNVQAYYAEAQEWNDAEDTTAQFDATFLEYVPETTVLLKINHDLPHSDAYSSIYEDIYDGYRARYWHVAWMWLAGILALVSLATAFLRCSMLDTQVRTALANEPAINSEPPTKFQEGARIANENLQKGYEKTKQFLIHWKLPRRIWKWLVSLANELGKLPLLAQYALWIAFYIGLFLFGIGGQSVFLLGLFGVAGIAHGAYIAWQAQQLCDAIEELSEGEFDFQMDTNRMQYKLKQAGEDLNCIADGVQIAVEERTKSERMKTELITNVSHDIKTPLTSIINYVDLIAKEPTDNPKITDYATVLHRQSERLKKLIEDLVEASKASTGNVEVHWEDCDLQVLLSQVVAEYQSRLESEQLSLVVRQPQSPLHITADGKLLWRVLDNLMNNVYKYAQPSTRVFLQLDEDPLYVYLTIKNTSKYPLDLSEEELKERFVRGDASRSTEGNGLGLSIAQSLTELQNGKLQLVTDGDLFKVRLTFPKPI